MKPHIACFNLRLVAGRNIGYATLLDIWRNVTASKEVSLRRTALGHDPHGNKVYTLCASRGVADMAHIESKLRGMLPEGLVGPAMQLTRLT